MINKYEYEDGDSPASNFILRPTDQVTLTDFGNIRFVYKIVAYFDNAQDAEYYFNRAKDDANFMNKIKNESSNRT